MKKNENNLENIQKINNVWYTELKKDVSLSGVLMNEPFSDRYWAEKYKIVLCNLESCDQSTRNENILDLNIFKEWLEKNNRTIKRSALFIY